MNNSYLIDSHVFVWLLYSPDLLNEHVKLLVTTADQVFVSRISLIELAFKHGAGKFAISPSKLEEGVTDLGVKILEINAKHLSEYANTRMQHKDPFDKLLITQSRVDSLHFITADKTLIENDYPVIDARP